MNKKIIALVGRPNVGKSTLFNRLSNKVKALVHNSPGVTRDRKYADANLNDLPFIVIDTPGLEESKDSSLQYRMMQQTKHAIIESDLVCLMIDAAVGITPVDEFFTNFIRKYTKNYVIIANKCEKSRIFDKTYYKIGFGDPIAISAQHGTGMNNLYYVLQKHIESNQSKVLPNEYINKNENISCHLPNQSPTEELNNSIARNLQIVVTGKPNVGKSTFINAIINNERLLTGPEAGITRESIVIDLKYYGNNIKLIDTAGLRKQKAIKEKLEKLSSSDAIYSINFANTVVLMINSQSPLDRQDLNIARYTLDQGRSLVIVVNKWDLISQQDRKQFKDILYDQLEMNLAQAKGLPIVFISAINKEGIKNVIKACIKTYDLWNIKLSTSKLNQWLNLATTQHPLPLYKQNKRIRIKYITQTKTRPPTFKLFTNNTDGITVGYKKYLVNDLRKYFDLPAIPLRLLFTTSDNPYIK